MPTDIFGLMLGYAVMNTSGFPSFEYLKGIKRFLLAESPRRELYLCSKGSSIQEEVTLIFSFPSILQLGFDTFE